MINENFNTLMDLWDAITKDMSREDRVEFADVIINGIAFDRRLQSLTTKQIEHMTVMEGITEEQRKRIDASKTDENRDDVIEEYARGEYFKTCAWVDYLNNGGKPPLEDPEQL